MTVAVCMHERRLDRDATRCAEENDEERRLTNAKKAPTLFLPRFICRKAPSSVARSLVRLLAGDDDAKRPS